MEESTLTRGLLDDVDMQRIKAKLPDVIPLRVKTQVMHPDLMCAGFDVGSDIPLAAICLQDASGVLCAANVALHEYHAHSIYYRERKDPPQEMVAISMETFFLDDLAFRLYAAAEHLANAIVFMLELTDADLAQFRESRVSQQSIVGHYLAAKLPGNDLTKAATRLAKCKDWMHAMGYRGRLVHDQPPPVAGLGITYRRRSRWTRGGGAAKLTVQLNTGDEPEFAVEEIYGFLEGAFRQLLISTDECVRYFESMLNAVGITLTVDKPGMHLRFEST